MAEAEKQKAIDEAIAKERKIAEENYKKQREQEEKERQEKKDLKKIEQEKQRKLLSLQNKCFNAACYFAAIRVVLDNIILNAQVSYEPSDLT